MMPKFEMATSNEPPANSEVLAFHHLGADVECLLGGTLPTPFDHPRGEIHSGYGPATPGGFQSDHARPAGHVEHPVAFLDLCEVEKTHRVFVEEDRGRRLIAVGDGVPTRERVLRLSAAPLVPSPTLPLCRTSWVPPAVPALGGGCSARPGPSDRAEAFSALHPASSTVLSPATMSWARLRVRMFMASSSQRAVISRAVRSAMTLPSKRARSLATSTGTW